MNKNRKHKFCEVHNDKTPILLYPDYSSGGMWCKTCGISFGDPSFYFKDIPDETIERVDEWDFLWSLMMNDDCNRKYPVWNDIFIRIGKRLCKEIRALGYECTFDEDRFYLK